MSRIRPSRGRSRRGRGHGRTSAGSHGGEPLTSVAEARQALDYWLARLERLPHRRRRARLEARAMIARWERRYRDAVVARRVRSPLGRLAQEVGLGRLLDPGPAPGNPVARWRRRRALEASRRRSRRRRGRGWLGSRRPGARRRVRRRGR